MTQQTFSEVEERIFALLDNAEQTQAQASELLTQLTDVLAHLETAETERTKKFAEIQEQANTSAQQHQQAWTDWKAEQTKLLQSEYQQKALDWTQAQTNEWLTWRNTQQQEMQNAIQTVTQSTTDIIAKLDNKIITVNLTAQSINTLIQQGTADAVEKLMGDQFKQSVGESLKGIANQLRLTDSLIQASENSAEQLKTSFLELENSAFDTLKTKIEDQVKIGVVQGLTAGLADSVETMNQSLSQVEAKGLELQDNLVNAFKTNLEEATNEVRTAKEWALSDIYLSHQSVKNDSAECIESLRQVKQLADASVVDVKEYHANLVNKGHWRWVAGWTALLTLLVTGAGIITYQVNKPDYAERNAVATQVQTLLQQKSAIEHSYSMRRAKAQDGKFYIWVDKSDCIDGDYCKQREPTGYTTPTLQQLTPPKPVTAPTQNTSSTYQPAGDSRNMYGGTTGANGNPFGESSGKYEPNPYKRP